MAARFPTVNGSQGSFLDSLQFSVPKSHKNSKQYDSTSAEAVWQKVYLYVVLLWHPFSFPLVCILHWRVYWSPGFGLLAAIAKVKTALYFYIWHCYLQVFGFVLWSHAHNLILFIITLHLIWLVPLTWFFLLYLMHLYVFNRLDCWVQLMVDSLHC